MQIWYENTDKVQEIAGVFIYPKEYFCPKDYVTGELKITKNSYCIHWYTASWASPYGRFKHKLKRISLVKMILRVIR